MQTGPTPTFAVGVCELPGWDPPEQRPPPKPGCSLGSIPQCHPGLPTGAPFPSLGAGVGTDLPLHLLCRCPRVTHTRGTLDVSCLYLRAQHLPGPVGRELPVPCSSSSCYKYISGLQLVGPHLCLAFNPVWIPKTPAPSGWNCGASGSAGCPWMWCWSRGRAQPPLPMPELRMSVDVLPPCLAALLLLLLLSQRVRAGTEGDFAAVGFPVLAGELCQSTELEGTPQSMQLPKQ